jgi:hypothetical protein
MGEAFAVIRTAVVNTPCGAAVLAHSVAYLQPLSQAMVCPCEEYDMDMNYVNAYSSFDLAINSALMLMVMG